LGNLNGQRKKTPKGRWRIEGVERKNGTRGHRRLWIDLKNKKEGVKKKRVDKENSKKIGGGELERGDSI